MKISVIGAGNVGASVALKICEKGLGDVVLVDIVEGMPQGKALDILEAMPLQGSDAKIQGSNDFSAIKDSDIVVMTAGLPRKPGMSRDDLQKTNADIIAKVAEPIKKHAPGAIVIVVTNPLDIMAYYMLKKTGFKKNKVIGMAGVLDSTRFRAFIAEALDVSVTKVEALVLGGHGDSMVPLAAHTLVDGKPLSKYLSQEKIDALVRRTQNGGAEIVNLLKTGSAFYAPGASVVEMIEEIINETGKILPCAVLCEGEFGLRNVFVGVPVRLCRDGIKEIVRIKLSPSEQKLLEKSAADVAENIRKLI